MGQRGDIQNLQAFVVNHERVAKLDSYALRFSECDFRFHFRREWVFDIHHHQAAITQDVRVMSSNGDASRAVQNSARIKCASALQEIVRGLLAAAGGRTRRWRAAGSVPATRVTSRPATIWSSRTARRT